MSLFLCPLCGKQVSIKYFHPESFDDEVEIFHNVGLGRGKGLKKILGYDLCEFPELHSKIVNRTRRILEFLSPQTETHPITYELEQKLEDERRKRVFAEEQLEELDIDPLFNKLNGALGARYSDVHKAVDELISRNSILNGSNQNLRSVNQSIESSHLRVEQENRNLVSVKNRVQREYNELMDINQKWAKAYQDLEAQHDQKLTEYKNALANERNRRISLEDQLEELDLDALLHTLNQTLDRKYSTIHSAVDALIQRTNSLENERAEVLNFINDTLPEEYDLYDDLDDAIAAFYQYYEDQVEELSDE